MVLGALEGDEVLEGGLVCVWPLERVGSLGGHVCVFSLCIVGLGGKDIEPTCR